MKQKILLLTNLLRGLFFILFTVLFTILFLSCGLERETPTLTPPTFVGISGRTIEFKYSVEEEEPALRGFELYYKLYSFSAVDFEEDYYSHEDLTSHGFKKIYAAGNSKNNYDKPLIEKPDSDHLDDNLISIVLEFNDEPIINANYLGDDIELRRGVLDEVEYYKKFSDFAEDDEDISAIIFDDIQSFSSIYILIYTFSYGRSTDDLINEVYSKVVCLGKVDLEIP